MRLLVASEPDPASVGLRAALLAQGGWDRVGEFDGQAAHARGDDLLVSLRGLHLHEDFVEDRAAPLVADTPEAVVFLSKHKSESGKPTLTVHPIGNWTGEAAYGGKPRRVCPSPAPLMAGILQALAREAPKGYAASFEATHHGPDTRAPACFVEVGSGPDQWRDAAALSAVAAAVAPARPVSAPAVVWVGGGHYGPRATDSARRGAYAPGHILPSHAFRDVTAETVREAAAGITGCAGYVVDPRAETEVATLKPCLDASGMRRVGR